MGNIVEIKQLNKVYTDKQGQSYQALKDINLEVEEGEFLSIIGGSGCGKSTLLRLIGGLDVVYEGNITFKGKRVEKPNRSIGYVFQDHRLVPWMTVKENIEFAMNNEGNCEDIIQKNIHLVGLTGFENSYPKQLSGGMAQRTAIARALSTKPDILLLDEPFGALDAITRVKMQNELLKIWKQEKISMILVTHDIEEAVYLGNRVVIMDGSAGVAGSISNIEKIDCGYPRNRTLPDFIYAKNKISKSFFEDAEIPIEYNI